MKRNTNPNSLAVVLMRNLAIAFVCFSLLSPIFSAEPPSPPSEFWPQWRGPQATGVAPQGNPPVEWSETKNVRWKVEIPGSGSATPILWEDKVFVVTAVPTGDAAKPDPGQERRSEPEPATQAHKFSVLALSRDSGKILWDRVVREEFPHEGKHTTGTWASGSPATDGEHVFAFFGSRGLYAIDMEGNVSWEKDLGDMEIRRGFGEGASPLLHEDRIIVNWDHQGQSFIVALDKKTGEEIWKVDRDEITAWTTPIVVEQGGRQQVIVSATGLVRSYDFQTGELIWQSPGMTLNAIPTPVAADGMVFLTSGFRGNSMLAVRLAEAQGDITDSKAVVWKHDRDTPYVPSPLLYGDTLYFLKRNSGIISSFNAKTGKVNYQMRLREVPNVYASPVGASNRIYIPGREGTTAVLEHGPEFKVLAVNALEEGFDASPAVAGDEIYLRGRQYLYCIAEN